MSPEHERPTEGEIEFELGSYVPPFGPYLSPRGRARRVAAIAAVLLMALASLVASSPALRASLRALVLGASPRPSPVDLDAVSGFYFQPNVPWATVLVDGRPASYTPEAALFNSPLTLAPGTHLIEWRADPFLPLRCELPVPLPNLLATPVSAGECPRSPWYGAVPGLILDERDSLAALPTAQQLALRTAIAQGLAAAAPSGIVRPGERFAAPTTAYPYYDALAASQPVKATLRLTPTSGWPEPCDASRWQPCRFPQQDCQQICTLPEGIVVAIDPSAWIAAVPVSLQWTFVGSRGTVTTPQQPLLGEVLVVLRITWDAASGMWHAAPIFGHAAAGDYADDTVCALAREEINTYRDPAKGPLRSALMQGTEIYRTNANPLDGCAIGAALNSKPAMPAQGQGALFLDRFGVLLAANGAAHAVAPSLPVANQADQSLTERILAQAPTT